MKWCLFVYFVYFFVFVPSWEYVYIHHDDRTFINHSVSPFPLILYFGRVAVQMRRTQMLCVDVFTGSTLSNAYRNYNYNDIPTCYSFSLNFWYVVSDVLRYCNNHSSLPRPRDRGVSWEALSSHGKIAFPSKLATMTGLLLKQPILTLAAIVLFVFIGGKASSLKKVICAWIIAWMCLVPV